MGKYITDARLIALIGVSKCARKVGLTRVAVHKWTYLNWVPVKHRVAIADLAIQSGVHIDRTEWLTRERPETRGADNA